MKFFIQFAGLICLLTGLSAQAQDVQAGPVRLAADVWCPFTCAANQPQQGFLVELLVEIYGREQLAINYQVTAWRRAIKGAEAAHFDILLGATGDSPNLLLTRNFAIKDETVFVVLKNAGVKLQQPVDLARYRVGRIQEYDYSDAGPWYRALMTNTKTLLLESGQGEARLLELVLVRRLDVAVVNRQVAETFAHSHGQEGRLLMINPQVFSPLYLGFQNTARGRWLRDVFERHFPAVRKSARFHQLLARYGLSQDLILAQ